MKKFSGKKLSTKELNTVKGGMMDVCALLESDWSEVTSHGASWYVDNCMGF